MRVASPWPLNQGQLWELEVWGTRYQVSKRILQTYDLHGTLNKHFLGKGLVHHPIEIIIKQLVVWSSRCLRCSDNMTNKYSPHDDESHGQRVNINISKHSPPKCPSQRPFGHVYVTPHSLQLARNSFARPVGGLFFYIKRRGIFSRPAFLGIYSQ